MTHEESGVVPILNRLRAILGHLADVERRLQSQVPVPREELATAAREVDELQVLAQQMGPGSGPWDVFYRKYNALLHDHLQAAGLRPGAPQPPAWDFAAALQEVQSYAGQSESGLRTVTFVRSLYDVVGQLEAGQQVGDEALQPLLGQMDEMADNVLELAPKHPQLPGQFARARQRLQELLQNRRPGEGT